MDGTALDKYKQMLKDKLSELENLLPQQEAKRALEREIIFCKKLLQTLEGNDPEKAEYQDFLQTHQHLKSQHLRLRQDLNKQLAQDKRLYQFLGGFTIFLVVGAFYGLVMRGLDKNYDVAIALIIVAIAGFVLLKLYSSFQKIKIERTEAAGLHCDNFMLSAFFPLIKPKPQDEKLAGWDFFKLANRPEPPQHVAYNWNEFELLVNLHDNLLITKDFNAPFKSQLLIISKQMPFPHNPKFEQHFHYFPDFEAAFVCCSNQRGEAAAFLEKNEELIWEINYLLGGASFIFANHKLFCWSKSVQFSYFGEEPPAESMEQYSQLRALHQSLELIRKIRI